MSGTPFQSKNWQTGPCHIYPVASLSNTTSEFDMMLVWKKILVFLHFGTVL